MAKEGKPQKRAKEAPNLLEGVGRLFFVLLLFPFCMPIGGADSSLTSKWLVV